MPVLNMLAAIRWGLEEALTHDERVVLIGRDIGVRGGVFGVTQGLLERFGDQRIIDGPPGGAALVGVSIGVALAGFRPVCEIQFADFIHLAFNQIVNEAARLHYRSAGGWQVPLTIRAPYGSGLGGGLYHSQCVEAFFSHVPGLKVVVPSNPFDAKGLLLTAISDPNPVLFLEPKISYQQVEESLPEYAYSVPLGSARISHPGRDLSLITYGSLHPTCLSAAQALEKEGLRAEVIDLRTLSPLDEATLLDSVHRTGKALIVHEDNRSGGFGAELAARLAEQAFSDLDAPVRRLAGADFPAVPFSPALQQGLVPDLDQICQAMRELAAY